MRFTPVQPLTPAPHPPRATAGACRSTGLIAIAAIAAACAPTSPGRQQLTAADFVAPALADAGPGEPQPAAPAAASAAPALPEVATGDLPLIELVARPGAPRPEELVRVDGAPPRYLVDAKVGEIAGEPVYAGQFLEPMSARFRAEAAQRPRADWLRWAEEQIRVELNALVNNELLHREALASLKPEQRRGLVALVERMREDLRSRNYGSSILAQRRLEEEQDGLTLEEYLKRREERELIAYHLLPIRRRVHVSRRDIEREYLLSEREFRPPPVAVLRLITIRADDPQSVEAVDKQLRDGAPFAEVAARPVNLYRPDRGGLAELEFSPPFQQAAFWAAEQLNDATRSLQPGQWTGPVQFRSDSGQPMAAWILLESIRQESVSLSEAEFALGRILRAIRENLAERRYVERLRQRADFTREDEDEMVRRLLDIAAARFLPPDQP